LKTKRDKGNVTQDKLSKLLDIPYTDVSKIENGRKKFKFDKLSDLAKILKNGLARVKIFIWS
jgi:transcriptional regulator with XRE-family HTH domain